MVCPNCGTECAQNAAFCDWCGAKLHSDELHFNECESEKYSFVNALEDYWQNAFNFCGRARRKEFWFACIWNFIFAIIISVVGKLISYDLQLALEVAFYAGILIPNISLAFRRIHDIGKSACWLLIGFVPILGHIILAVLFALDGEKKENVYGKRHSQIRKYCPENRLFVEFLR